MTEHPTQDLAERVVAASLAHAPAEAIRIAKDTFLDTIGCMLAGSTETGARLVASSAHLVGNGTSLIVGASFRGSPFMAALANGTSAAILDYDDGSWECMAHISGVVVPAVLALGEELGTSGRRVFEAYLVGYETASKIGRCLGHSLYAGGRHNTGAIGVFGVAAACAKLLELDATRTAIAFGIAGSYSGALRAGHGTMTKGLHSGAAAANGMLSASLAAQGFDARPDILETKYGLAEAAGQGRSFPLHEIGRDFGAPWSCVDPGVGIKLIPSGTTSFCAAECALEIATTNHLDPRTVDEVEFRSTPVCLDVARYGVPENLNQAFYSIPWAVAVSLVDRKTGLAQFTEERIRDPLVRELCARVRVTLHPDHQKVEDLRDNVAGELVVRLKDGRELRHFRRRPRAFPGGEPWTREQLLEKYREAAARVLPPQRIEASISLLSEIENLPNTSMLTEVLQPPS